jgi:hypothetical protein
MPSIKMKIVNYDPSTSSLIVSFASEKAKKSIEEYPSCAYQPTMFDTHDPEKVIENIARAGIFVTQQQDKEEEFQENTNLTQVYQSYIGKEFDFDVDTLLASSDQVVEQYVQTSTVVDEILDEILIDDSND